MDCFSKQDLNPRTCRFSLKCKPGFTRNEKFLCRKSKKKNSPLNAPLNAPLKLNSPKLSLETMIHSLKNESPKVPLKRVFPTNSEDLSEDGKDYIIFEGGIMLADTLYKDGKMLQLSKALSKTYKQPPNGWYLSEKYDGLRGIWTVKELLARPSKKDGVMKGKVFNYVPEWFINLLPRGVSLDGELWLGRGKFQEISGLSNYKLSKKITKEYLDSMWKEVKFMVFDVPHSKLPYIDRLE